MNEFQIEAGALTAPAAIYTWMVVGFMRPFEAARCGVCAIMIVCSCNLLTTAEIRAALTQPDGPACVRDVYAACGCAPVCGGCAGAIAKMLEEARPEALYSPRPAPQKVAA